MVPQSQRQEALSRAYVRAVSARAGVTCTDLVQDFGADMVLRHVAQKEHRYVDDGRQLDLQLKSTTRAELDENEVSYDLDVRAYNWSRQHQVYRPRILVLLVLPEDEAQWLSQSLEELVLRRCAYWTALRGAEPTTKQRTIRVRLPRANVFSSAAVCQLLDEARTEGKP
jgi:hypothetical protein